MVFFVITSRMPFPSPPPRICPCCCCCSPQRTALKSPATRYSAILGKAGWPADLDNSFSDPEPLPPPPLTAVAAEKQAAHPLNTSRRRLGGDGGDGGAGDRGGGGEGPTAVGRAGKDVGCGGGVGGGRVDVVGVVVAVKPGSERRPGIRTCTAERLFAITLYGSWEHSFCCTLRMKAWWESNINVWFWFMYFQKGNCVASLFQKHNYNFLSPYFHIHVSVDRPTYR